MKYVQFVDTIEYLKIYPHLILYGKGRISIKWNGIIHTFNENDDKSLIFEINDDISNLSYLFKTFRENNYKCIFVKFDEKIRIDDRINIIKNISLQLESMIVKKL